jgi:hypothetical protein
MKKQVFFFGSILLFFALHTPAQTAPNNQNNSTNQNSQVNPQTADVSITASVTAKELKFDVVPNPTVKFPGKPERVTVWEADRQNLPKPVEPGVTYRNIGIQLRIASRFANIDCIVSEALGEVPVADETAKPADTTQLAPLAKESKVNNQTKQLAKTKRRVSAQQRRN